MGNGLEIAENVSSDQISNSEAENTVPDLSATNQANNTDGNGFLDGLLSAEEAENSDNSLQEETTEKATEEEPESSEKSQKTTKYHRPDKRTREFNRRMEEMLEQNRRQSEELAQYRQMMAEQQRQMMPEADEDGNYSVESIMQASRASAEEAMRAQLEQYQAQVVAKEREHNAKLAEIGIENTIKDAINRYEVLNPDKQSYSSELDELIRENIKVELFPFVQGNNLDPEAITATVKDSIERTMSVVEKLRQGSQKAQNIQQMRSNSPITGGEAYTGGDEDGFLNGLFSG